MSKFSLLIDIIIASVLYGVIAIVGGFFALLAWSELSFDWILRGSAIIGVSGAIAGAAIPFTRNFAVSIFSFFAPLS